jgi:hypothetical protein
MPGIIVLAKVYEILAEKLAPTAEALFLGSEFSHTLRRPIRVSANLRILLADQQNEDESVAFEVRDELDELVIVGTARIESQSPKQAPT